jgi:hypothetical protein
MKDYQTYFCRNNTRSKSTIKKILKRENLIPYECGICHNPGIHLGKPLSLQLDHKNGVSNDDRIENLRWLCPNCHAQTENYAGRNRRGKSKKEYITEEIIVDTLKKVDNINQLLVLLGASNTNGNYKKVKRVMKKYNLKFEVPVMMIITDKKAKRKVDRPSKEILEKEIRSLPMIQIGFKYGVSDNAVRKWCVGYDIPLPKVGRGYWGFK